MAKKPIHINLFGGGNVATHLAWAFIKHPGIKLQQIYNRHIENIAGFKNDTEIIDDLTQVKPADAYILALKDDVIADFSKKLKAFNVLTVHTSGSLPMSALQIKRKGVFYPFQTFSKAKKDIDFKEIPVLIEADYPEDLNILKKLAGLLSENVQIIDSQQRKALHIAGVFAANFVNHLYTQADKILQEHELSFDLIKPLIMEVAQKVQSIPPAQAQTGPAARSDQKIINDHLSFIKKPYQKEIYKLLTDSILKEKYHE